MKKILITLAALTLSLPAAEKLAVLKLKDGTEYKKVEITGVSEKGVRILHDSGAANVPVDQLPADLQAKYGQAQAKAAGDAATAEAAAKAKAEADVQAKAKATAAAPPPSAPMPAGNAAAQVPQAAPAATPSPQPKVMTGKIFGLAEVMADLHKLEGLIVRVEVIPNTASKIESIGPGLYSIFVGDPFAKADSDYVRMSFPEEGRGKVETMLKGRRGKMTFYMEVRADKNPQIHAVGRSTSSGGPGTPIIINW